MTSRFGRLLVEASFALSLAALVLAGVAMLTRDSSDNGLDGMRVEVSEISERLSEKSARGDDELSQRIGDLEGRIDELASQLSRQAFDPAAAEALGSLTREIDRLRTIVQDEFPEIDYENYIPGDVVEEGRFVILQSGNPVGEESFRFYAAARSYTLVSTMNERRLGRNLTIEQQCSLDSNFRPVSYQLRGTGPTGPLDVSAEARGGGIEIQTGQTSAPILLSMESPAVILDSGTFGPWIAFQRAMASREEAEAQWSCIVPRDAEALPLRVGPAEAVTLVDGAARLEASRYVVTVGDGREIAYSTLNGEVMAVEIPSDAVFAYRSDRFPDGVLVEPRDIADLALPFGVLEANLSLTNGGLRLNGKLTYPSFGGETVPIFLLLPDLAPFDSDGNRPGQQTGLLKQMALSLAQQGVASYRFDLPGLGASDGDFSSTTVADLLMDARIALLLVKALPFADPANVYVMGHGAGGILAMLLASGSEVGGLVTVGTPAQPIDVMEVDKVRRRAEAAGLPEGEINALVAQERDFFEFARSRTEATWTDVPFEDVESALPWMTRAELARRGDALPLPLLRGFSEIDPVVAMQAVGVLVLMIQGDKDFEVPLENVDLLARALEEAGNPDGKVSVFPDVNHWLRRHTASTDSLDQHLDSEIDGWVMVDVLDWLGPALELPPGGSGTQSPRT
jgi:pimeloyl-ACP methyl ester carboxylesterase/TolA-binding protein